MQVTLRKNSWLWFRSCQFSLAIPLLPLMYLFYVAPELVSPRFANAIPFVFAIFVVCSIIALLLYVVWLFNKPKYLIIDLQHNEVRSETEVVCRFLPTDICLLKTHDNKITNWYRFGVEKKNSLADYQIPIGYLADISYIELLDYLELHRRPFCLYHAPWVFKASQTPEDQERHARGEALQKSSAAHKP